MAATKTRRATKRTKAGTNGRSAKAKVGKAPARSKPVTYKDVLDGVPGSARKWLIDMLQASRDIAYTAQGWCFDVYDGGFQCDLDVEIEALKKQGESKKTIATVELAQEALREAYDAFAGACEQGVDFDPVDKAIEALKKG